MMVLFPGWVNGSVERGALQTGARYQILSGLPRLQKMYSPNIIVKHEILAHCLGAKL